MNYELLLVGFVFRSDDYTAQYLEELDNTKCKCKRFILNTTLFHCGKLNKSIHNS